LITVASDDSPLDEKVVVEGEGEGTEFASKEAEAVWQALTNRELKPPNLATQVVSFSNPSLMKFVFR